MLTVDFDRLAVKEGNIVLDAGCGYGRHSVEFISRGARVVSMDLDMESLRQTRFAIEEMKKAQKKAASSGYMAHVGDALNLPFKENTFDRIICSEVMEHVDNDFKACGELARVLKKNGMIAITVPTFFSEQIYDVLTHEYYTSPGGHVRRYMPKQLAAIMRDNGLEVYGIGFKHSYHTIWWMIRSVVGLHNADHPLTKAYHKFLHLGLFSNTMRRIEGFLNYFFPKSVVIYAWKK